LFAKGFIAEMRSVAMRLHTKEQAPKEGKAQRPPEQRPMPQVRGGAPRAGRGHAGARRRATAPKQRR
jgi:hypothetical protein